MVTVWLAHAWPSPRGEVHVWPESDWIEHELDGTGCVCGPHVELIRKNGRDVWLVHHAALRSAVGTPA